MIKNNPVTRFLLLPLSLVLLELGSHYLLFTEITADAWMSVLAALALGSVLNLLISFLPKTLGRIVMGFLLFAIGAYYAAMMVYYEIFQSFFLWSTIGLAGDVTAFWREALGGIKENLHMIIFAMIPFLLFIILFRKNDFKSGWKARIITLLIGAMSAGYLTWTLVKPDYFNLLARMQEDATSTYHQFGIITSSFNDVYQTIYGVPEEKEAPEDIDVNLTGKMDIGLSEPKVILKNALDIDFETMIAKEKNSTVKAMHEYFASRPATSQNDYTGYFEGKNLIFLSLEGFSYKAVSPELTPTLYKMMTQGFHFTNFYDSLWGGSTATGEYSNMTGNFYTSATCLKKSANTFTYSALGNLFAREGYKTLAYHNGTYTYYGRDKSHPNFGYEKYKAVGNGLKLEHSSWPNSDYEMAVATVDDFINIKEPWHVYYMTISGHTRYTFTGNVMARRHKKEVSHLKASDDVKAYIATEIEVENMLKYLCEKLEAAGKLDDTVFAMSCDHYPYGLPDAPLAELYDLPQEHIRGNIELYHNAFILYCSSMKEPVIVDTPCSSIDMVPTLANLFGCTYDSRFISGTDIFAPEENICIINTLNSHGGSWNWKTTQGSYHTVSKKFIPAETCTLTADEQKAYVSRINSAISKLKKNSYGILDNDYYSHVFNKDGTPKYPLK